MHKRIDTTCCVTYGDNTFLFKRHNNYVFDLFKLPGGLRCCTFYDGGLLLLICYLLLLLLFCEDFVVVQYLVSILVLQII